jgi:cullin 3
LGLELFRDTVLRSSKYPVHTHLYTTLLTQIQVEREGSVINRSALKSNIDMLTSLTHPRPHTAISARTTVYNYDFEPAFLATSEEFYRAEAERLLDNNDAAQYLRHVERRFVEEEARVAVYLSSATDRPLSKLLEKCLLSRHLSTILNMSGSGVVTMLDDDRVEDLARMYRLFWRVPEGADVMKAGLRLYIGTRGKEINEQVAAAAKGTTQAKEEDGGDVKSSVVTTPPAQVALKWVEDVLTFKNKFDHIWRVSFEDDKGCETSINEAFEAFVNSNSRAPEFISLFIDENLKKGLKGKTEEEVEETLNQTITVFRFLHEKDVFERYYKGHLAKRLLQGRSVSDDAERGMMAKLKIECGHGYVQKLQGMLNDMKVSEETMSLFNDQIERSKRPMPFDISVNVLTSTYWPISAVAQPCTMAPCMIDVKQAFERFYQSRHSGRLLTWHPNQGNADVRVQFKARKHELNVSTYALVVLLLFENIQEGEKLSWESIQTSTGITEQELNRTLQSLACAKYKILLKEPKGREVNKEDSFSFNDGFQCNLARIKIAQIAARVETATERKETTEKVEEERKNQVEACIVRVMKDRKTMTHNELVNEVIRQLTNRFNPSPQLVKRRIESLIDREYLERSDSSMNVYNYQA